MADALNAATVFGNPLGHQAALDLVEAGREPGLLGLAAIEIELLGAARGPFGRSAHATGFEQVFPQRSAAHGRSAIRSPEDRSRILHMIEAASDASQFVIGRRREDLDADPMLLFALVRAVEVFGEAAPKVSPPTKAATPDLPWPHIVAMRNRLIHAYFDIGRDIVWKTGTEEIPALLPRLRELIRD